MKKLKNELLSNMVEWYRCRIVRNNNVLVRAGTWKETVKRIIHLEG